MNNVIALTDKNGKLTEEYTYTPYGNPMSREPSAMSQYLFTGRRYDPESGLYYFRNRYYDPELGRFIQEDPQASIFDTNTYNYPNNNPINLRDPYGLCGPCSIKLGLLKPGESPCGGGGFSLWGLLFFIGGVVAAPVLGPAAGLGVALKAVIVTGLTIGGSYAAYKGYRKARDLYREYKQIYRKYKAKLKGETPSPKSPWGEGPPPVIPIENKPLKELMENISRLGMPWFEFPWWLPLPWWWFW